MPDGPLNPPLVMASTYHAGGEMGYGRYGNPTWEMLETAVGALEGGVTRRAYASGIAAVAAVLDLVPPGGVVVAPPDAYYGTGSLLPGSRSRAGSRCGASISRDRTAARPRPSTAPTWSGPRHPRTRC